ncbi:hypothetical protein [Rufibacter radiotolerans]|nr:hypothetical protein [Rufibacter radiotolerans]
MRILSLLTVMSLLIFSSCGNEKTVDTKLPLPPEIELHSIIRTIIQEDSLPVLIGKSGQYSLSAVVNSFRILLDTSNHPVVLPGEGIRWKDLLSVKADSLGTSKLFAPEDSAYLMLLNSTWLKKRNTIKNLRADGIKVEALLNLEEKLNESPGKATAFYIFSNPVVSKDFSRAYIELAFACDRLCGYGHSYSLKKVDGRWRIVNEEITYFE